MLLCLIAIAFFAALMIRTRTGLRVYSQSSFWSSAALVPPAVVTVLNECEDDGPCFVIYDDDPRYDCIVQGTCAPRAQPHAPVAIASPVAATASQSPPPAASASPSCVPSSSPSVLPADILSLVRDPSLVPPQRPIAHEADLTSHAFEEVRAHSLNPPKPLTAYSAAAAAEISSRLVIAVGCGVYSGGKLSKDTLQLSQLRMFRFWMTPDSFLRTIQTNHVYRVYLAFDHDDPIYEDAGWRDKIEAEFNRIVKEEDARRWHPPGYIPGVTIDGSALLVSLHWVHCDFSHKPAWAHTDAIMAAYKEGADYAYRPNDDTKFPSSKDWADRFVATLRALEPITNLGVVGPNCHEGAAHILTHDFTHKTHAVVFGFHYPRSLPNWSSDDWITYMYASVGLMRRLDDVLVEHVMDQTNYPIDTRDIRVAALLAAMKSGGEALDAWTTQQNGLVLPRVNFDMQMN